MDEEVFYGLDDDELESKYLSERINLSSKGLECNRKNSKDDSNLNMKSLGLLNHANDIIYLEELKEIEAQNKIKLKQSGKGKFYDEAFDNIERKQLPAKRKKININVWGILKDAVTKDLSKFCVPGIY